MPDVTGTTGTYLQATALVHEACIRLVEGAGTNWNRRGHFFKAATEAMTRILVESARRKKRLKHGGDRQRIELGEADLGTENASDDLPVVNGALDKLSVEEPSVANLVQHQTRIFYPHRSLSNLFLKSGFH
ncbi:MAG: ECF-type sigma factor [Planctomycetota bacterium]